MTAFRNPPGLIPKRYSDADAKSLKTGASDGARTRDLRRDRPGLSPARIAPIPKPAPAKRRNVCRADAGRSRNAAGLIQAGRDLKPSYGEN